MNSLHAERPMVRVLSLVRLVAGDDEMIGTIWEAAIARR